MSILDNVRSRAGSWTGLGPWRDRRTIGIAAGFAVAAAGLALGWDWLTAIGVTPILIAALPCAAMCALGVCMHKSQPASGRADQARTDKPDSDERGA